MSGVKGQAVENALLYFRNSGAGWSLVVSARRCVRCVESV